MNRKMNDSVIEKMRNKRIPDYYPTMHMDGFTPYEILTAARNSIIREHEARLSE